MCEELKPCPFCGSSKVDVRQEFSCTPYQALCEDCGAELWRDSFAEAVKAWNTRHDEEEGIKPCPKCGSTNVELFRLKEVHGLEWFRIECKDCKTRTPSHESLSEALTEWEKRTNDEESSQ